MTEATSCPTLDVRVWHARVSDVWPAGSATAAATRWLDAAEQARYVRFRHETDRAMFLLGRMLARTAVADVLGVDARGWRWHEGPRGRPEVDAPHDDVSFNLAHSGGLVVVAVARHAQVGVDVERRSRPVLDRAIVDRYCAPAEARDVGSCGVTGWHDRFLEYWTLKEAYLKARGLGIGVPLAELNFRLDRRPIDLELLGTLAETDGSRWAFDLRPLGDEHYLATAVACAAAAQPTFFIESFPLERLRE